jgi:hypothetical protein
VRKAFPGLWDVSGGDIPNLYSENGIVEVYDESQNIGRLVILLFLNGKDAP